MAGIAAKSAVFKVKDSGGTLRDLSAFLTSINFPRPVDAEESETFGDSAKERTVTLTDSSFSIEGFWDGGAAPAPDVVLSGLLGVQGVAGAAGDYEYGPQGSTGGFVKYTGNAVLTSYEIGDEVDGLITFSAEFEGNGTVTRGVWP